MGPGDLEKMIAPLTALAGGHERVMVGPETGDDAGVYRLDGHALIATADFITPVCDDPRRYGRVAATNSLSDVYAMGGKPLFTLNLCCFPGDGIPDGVLAEVLRGAGEAMAEAGAALLGGHTVEDAELKFGLAVVGTGDPDRLLTNAGARPGDRLVLTKPLGTGVLVNAFKFDKLDEEGLEPALSEMERLNARAAELALAHGARAATDITGFGLIGHSLAVARASGVGIRLTFDALPVHDRFYDLAAKGITTGCTTTNRGNTEEHFRQGRRLSDGQREVLFDPQTSGGLLLSLPADSAAGLLDDLLASGHRAAEVGEVVEGPAFVEVI